MYNKSIINKEKEDKYMKSLHKRLIISLSIGILIISGVLLIKVINAETETVMTDELRTELVNYVPDAKIVDVIKSNIK